MSVINQVLSDLEKRGVGALADKSSVRAVPVQENRLKPALLVAALLVLAVALVMQWRSGAPPKPFAPVAEATLSSGKSNTAAAASAASAASVQVAPPHAEPQPEAPAAPAMRMSLELSAIPLPSSLRAQPQSVAATVQHPGSSVPAASVSDATKTAKPQQRSIAADKAVARTSAASSSGGVDKQIKQLNVQQQADNEFRKANGLLQQGRSSDALSGYEAALRLDPGHDAARQAIVALLLESKLAPEAERVLQDGLAHNPAHGGFAMLLARIQVERDALQAALDTLLKVLPHIGQQADYRAFVAALLQRLNHHQEAVGHYRAALQQAPASGVWLMGLGISLQALQRNEEARDAYQRALESRTLNAELQAFVGQRLKEL